MRKVSCAGMFLQPVAATRSAAAHAVACQYTCLLNRLLPAPAIARSTDAGQAVLPQLPAKFNAMFLCLWSSTF
jgi:hypothetical protein